MSLFDYKTPEQIENGRQRIIAGWSIFDYRNEVSDSTDMVAYTDSQRRVADRDGCCGHHQSHRMPNGILVCLHTRCECRRQELATALILWNPVKRKEFIECQATKPPLS